MEALIGAIVVWIVAVIMLFFPTEMLKMQKGTYKLIGAEFNYSEKTVKFIRFIGLVLIGVGLLVLFFG